MSDNYDEFENDDEDNSPAGLRAALKKAQAAAKKAAADLADERAAREAAEKRVKKVDLADLLKKAGVPEKFAARAEKDGAEATADGVKAWIEENQDFYNFGASKDATQEQSERDGKPNVGAELDAAIRQSQNLDTSGVTPSEVDMTTRIQSITARTEAELLRELAAAGVNVGKGY